jgi:hypothetical protein
MEIISREALVYRGDLKCYICMLLLFQSVDDTLILYEFDPEKDDPALAPAYYVHERGGLTFRVTAVFKDLEKWGLKSGFCILQLKPVGEKA